MALLHTDTEMSSELSLSSLEGVTLIEARSVVLPYILRFATESPPSEHLRNVLVLVNSTNRSITFVEGPFNHEAIFHEEGPLPASKASIESMSVVNVLDEGTDCTICLSDFEICEEAKEMPCRHRFHSICIDKWLGINGSCPICRYKMPVDEESGENDDKESVENDDEESGEYERDDNGGREMDRVMFVFHVIVRQDTGQWDLNSNTTSESSEVQTTSESSEVQRDSYEVLIGVVDHDESETQDMITGSN